MNCLILPAGRNLQQVTYNCTLELGCTSCPVGCNATAVGSCIAGDTAGRFRCMRCQLLPNANNTKQNLRPAADGSCGTCQTVT